MRRPWSPQCAAGTLARRSAKARRRRRVVSLPSTSISSKSGGDARTPGRQRTAGGAGGPEAGGLREVSQLEAFLGRERASGLLERRVGERLCGRQALGEGADERRRVRLAELFHAGRVEVHRVVAVNREGVRELDERARARAMERDRPGEKLRVKVRNAEWLQHLDEPCRRNLLEVLPVQPGELLV